MLKPGIYWEIPQSLYSSYSGGNSLIPETFFTSREGVNCLLTRISQPGDYVAERTENGQYENTFGGVMRTVKTIRRSFVFTVNFGIDDMRLLFEDLEQFQAATIYQTSKYCGLRVWDGVRCDSQDRKTGRISKRVGAITIEPSEGTLWSGNLVCNDSSGKAVITEQRTEPDSYWTPPFKVRFTFQYPDRIT